ncbi:STAS domain-containing protein [Actinoplanes sp. NPDC049599]|uniref:STAS domain-containing protein n=1 Tax=Actinoplanes sp. NPDC049599 TaxID=3363903 RepID=UPI003793FED4
MYSRSIWASTVFRADLTIRACAGAGCPPRARLRLVGEIDYAARPPLAEIITRVAASAPARVVIDLEGLGFATSELADFVVRLRGRLPRDADVVLGRAAPPIDAVLRLTDLRKVATVRGDSPATGAVVCAATV